MLRAPAKRFFLGLRVVVFVFVVVLGVLLGEELIFGEFWCCWWVCWVVVGAL